MKGYKTTRGKPTGFSATGAGNPSKASSLNQHKTGNPTVPHDKAHSARKGK